MTTTGPTPAPARAPSAVRGSGEARVELHRLRLRGATIYACRRCGREVRAVSTRYLPETCPSCGAGTWDADGMCAGTAGCSFGRPPGVRGRAFCPGCGHSIWRRTGPAQGR